MNNHSPARRILQDALTALLETTGLRGNMAAQDIKSGITDDIVQIVHGDKTSAFSVVIHKTDKGHVSTSLKAREHQRSLPTLLIAPYLTRQTAEHCRAIGMQFIDGAGNAYLEMPGLFVFVTGQRRKAGLTIEKTNYQSLTPTGLRLIFMLLTRPALVNASYRELAKAAGIAIGGVGRAIKDLEWRGYLTPEGMGPRRLLAADQLREEWIVHYPVKLRPKLRAQRFTHSAINALAPADKWWKNVDLHPYEAVWGGEVGADILTGYLRPQTITIYVHGAVEPLITTFRLKPDPHGEVEILETFWDKNDEKNTRTAPPLVVYADLVAAGNARAIETAKRIHEQFFR